MTSGTVFIGFFVAVVIAAVTINFIVNPAFDSISQTRQEVSVGQVSRTNTTGNDTAQYDTAQIGLFGDPQTQLLTVLVILGVSGAVAAVAILGTGAQPGPAAVVSFVVALALVVVNTLIAMYSVIASIPVLGVPLFVVVAGAAMAIILYVAAGFMASGSSQ